MRQVKLSVVLLDPFKTAWFVNVYNTRPNFKIRKEKHIYNPNLSPKSKFFAGLQRRLQFGFSGAHIVLSVALFFAFVLPENRRYFYDHCYHCFFVWHIRRRRRKKTKNTATAMLYDRLFIRSARVPGLGAQRRTRVPRVKYAL